MAHSNYIEKTLKKSMFFKLGLILFTAYFVFAGFYKLNYLPGLHGDEAWIGIKADDFNQYGVHQIRAMNNYTGILQILISQFAFNMWGIGVFQLRVGTVVLNVITILMITFYLIKQGQFKTAMFYVLILSQSSLLLAFYRVSWEVNTLTHLFLAASFILIRSINKTHNSNGWKYLLFLIVNILGCYNHIIFSCAPVAGFLAFIVWKLCFTDTRYDHLFALLGINFINIVAVFLVMRYCNYPIGENLLLFLSILFIIIFAEVWVIHYLVMQNHFEIPTVMILNWPVKILFVIGFLIFLFFHGISFSSVLANYKIFLEVYSLEQPTVFQIIFWVNAIVLVSYFFYSLYRAFNKKTTALFAFFILVYLSIFTLYVRNTSYRYYLELYFIFSFFIAYNLAIKTNRIVVSSLLLTLAVTVSTLYAIYFVNRPLKAIRFVRSPGQFETSAHFLPKEPLLNFIERNNIGYISSETDNPFFITQPLEFYKLIKPRPETASGQAVVMYDYIHLGTGFQFIK